MKIKTSELKGPALNWAVRQCVGPAFKDYIEDRDDFSTCWNKGGPIIERERIRLDCAWSDEWTAQHMYNAKIDGYTGWTKGPTALIAAMRCYVASKLGDEVEVPEELT